MFAGKGIAVDTSLIQPDTNKQRSIPRDEWKPEDIPTAASQAVKGYPATLDDAAFGAASPTIPKFTSPSGPAAQWTGARTAEPGSTSRAKAMHRKVPHDINEDARFDLASKLPGSTARIC